MLTRRLFLTITAAVAALFTFRRDVTAELLFVRPLRKEPPRVRPNPFTSRSNSGCERRSLLSAVSTS